MELQGRRVGEAIRASDVVKFTDFIEAHVSSVDNPFLQIMRDGSRIGGANTATHTGGSNDQVT